MIQQILTPSPWLITLDGFNRLAELSARPEIELAASAQTSEPPPPYGKRSTLDGGLLTLPVRGPIVRQITPYRRLMMEFFGNGVTVSPELSATLRKAAYDPTVHTVLLDIDSPGGSVAGTPELAAEIGRLAAVKHVYAFTAGQACSAAYWLASQTDGIFATPSAAVGSVGVIMPLIDSSANYAKYGFKVDAITAGRYKGAGLDGTTLTDEQRALLQAQVNETWAEFKAAVNLRREVADDCMEGQSFTGRQGAQNGMVDGLAISVREVQEKLIARHAIIF